MSGWAQRLEAGMQKAVAGVERGVVKASRAVEGVGVKTAVKVAGEGKHDEEIRLQHNLPSTEHVLYDFSTTAVTDSVFKGRITVTEGFLNFFSPTKPRNIAVSIPYNTMDRVEEGFVVYPRVAGQPLSVIQGTGVEPQVDVGEKAVPAILIYTDDNHIHTFTQLANYTMCFYLVRHLWIAGRSLAGRPVPMPVAPIAPAATAPVAAPVPVAEPVPVAQPVPEPTASTRADVEYQPPPSYEPAVPVPETKPKEVKPATQVAPATAPATHEAEAKPEAAQPIQARATAGAGAGAMSHGDDLAQLNQMMASGPVQPKK